MLHEKGFEAAEHHAVVENDEQGTRQGHEAEKEGAHVDEGIVEEDVPKHAQRVFVFVDRHRVAPGYVFERHFHIVVAEDLACKVGFHLLCEHAHQRGDEEDHERNEEFAPRIVEGHRDVVPECAHHLAPTVGSLAVDVLMKPTCDAFEVVGDGTLGEMRLGEGQIGRHIEIDLGDMVGIERGDGLTRSFISLPFLGVESYKFSFSHGLEAMEECFL